MASRAFEWYVRNPEKVRECAGKHIAIVGEKIVAVGDTAREVYELARKRHPREVRRPVVEVELEAEDGTWVKILAHADSGADITVFPRTVCEILGLKLMEGIKGSVSGVTGEEIKIL